MNLVDILFLCIKIKKEGNVMMNNIISVVYLNIPKTFFYTKVMVMKFIDSDFFTPAVKEVFKMLNL